MLNLFKKLQKPNNENGPANASPQPNAIGGAAAAAGQTNASYQPMGQHLQKKFARGIQYNMKIIIRGDRNVGKTCLFQRLQGDKFIEEYSPSEEIKVTSIQWNYNVSDDIVKVEIWDIVDKGKKRESLAANNSANPKEALKMHNNDDRNTAKTNEESSMVLDAEFVDVYKGTSGVIFMFDITKAWTYEYVEREIRKCPSNIPILILANRRDMGHHRVISSDQVHSFIDQLLKEELETKQQARVGQIRYAESSMRNGFGLRYLYKFLNLPYLHLQRQTLLKQLERNGVETTGTCQELDYLFGSEENNYDAFLEMITTRRRQLADQLSNVPSTTAPPVGPDTIPQNLPKSISMPANISKQPGGDVSRPEMEVPIAKPPPSIIIGANNPLPKTSFVTPSMVTENGTNSGKHPNSFQNIEDFIPDDGEQNVFRKFLDDVTAMQAEMGNHLAPVNEEDSDDNDGHPVVAKYQEELDPEDVDSLQFVSNFPLNDKPTTPFQSNSTDNTVSTKENDQLDNLCNATSTTLNLSEPDAVQSTKGKTTTNTAKTKVKRKTKESLELKSESSESNDKPAKSAKAGLKLKNNSASKTKPKSEKSRAASERKELEDFLGEPLGTTNPVDEDNFDHSAYEML